MFRCAVSALGRDRPGIVAALTEVLLDLGGNIEDSQMSILRGHFSVMLIVALPEDTASEGQVQRLTTQLEEVGCRLELEAVAVNPVEDLAGTAPEPSHLVTLYGADHPGIVHAAAAILAERDVSITGLETKLAGNPPGSIYVMLIEIAAAAVDIDELRDAISAAGEQSGLDVNLSELDRTPL